MKTVDFLYIFQQIDWFGNVTLSKGFSLDVLGSYLEISFAMIMSWIFIPFWTAIILPSLILLLLYVSALFIYLYGQLYGLKGDFASNAWDVARYILADLWYKHGRLWHGYEIRGLDNIPDDGPALLVYYHGAIPIDHYYLVAACYLKKNRLIHPVGDRFLFRVPGWEQLMNVLSVMTGTVQSCAEVLKEGKLISISPGGLYEAQFGDQNYELLWRKRIGFAKVAIESQAPIIPIFTQNVREAFRTVTFGRSFLQRVYVKCRLPVVPIFGGFPVKLRTIIGKPILYDSSVSADELALRTAAAIKNLIAANQRIPGSILQALVDRVYTRRKQL